LICQQSVPEKQSRRFLFGWIFKRHAIHEAETRFAVVVSNARFQNRRPPSIAILIRRFDFGVFFADFWIGLSARQNSARVRRWYESALRVEDIAPRTWMDHGFGHSPRKNLHKLQQTIERVTKFRFGKVTVFCGFFPFWSVGRKLI